jgi:putative tryptophan/tyrosine transport system substrate-binding protein
MQFDRLKRREFITLLGGAAAACAVAARAQQAAMPVVGFLHDGTSEGRAHFATAFREGLSEAGFVDGRNVVIEYHWAQDQFDRVPSLVAELVQRRVAVIATPGSATAALAAKAATSTIPIIFSVGSDPVKPGLVDSLNRPGGNVTGVNYYSQDLGPKRLGLLRELMPAGADVVVLVNPKSPITDPALKDLQAAASAVGQQLSMLHASNNQEIYAAFPVMAQRRNSALMIVTDPLFTSRRVQLVTLATRYAIPAIYTSREFTEVGGLMSYGTDLPSVYRQVGNYAGRILNGAKPSDLPVMQPIKFEFIINLATAKAFGIDVPATLLARADEVIE